MPDDQPTRRCVQCSCDTKVLGVPTLCPRHHAEAELVKLTKEVGELKSRVVALEQILVQDLEYTYELLVDRDTALNHIDALVAEASPKSKAANAANAFHGGFVVDEGCERAEGQLAYCKKGEEL